MREKRWSWLRKSDLYKNGDMVGVNWRWRNLGICMALEIGLLYGIPRIFFVALNIS